MNTTERRRKRLRLPGYDYSSPGWYFVTICTHQRRLLYGDVVGGRMEPTDAGKMVQEAWFAIPERYPHVSLDVMVVMPNHIHGIIVNNPSGVIGDRAPTRGAPTDVHPDCMTLGEVVGAYKSLTTHAYIRGVYSHAWSRFDKQVWQRSYYERVIRNERELLNIREYIANNPKMWDKDEENPINRVDL